MPEANKFEIGLLQLLKSKVQPLPIVSPVKDSKRKELRRLSSWADYMSTREAGEIWGYSMQGVARLYFPDKIIPTQQIEDDENNQEYARLMKPSSYSGRVERRNGAITQRHRGPLK